MDVSIGQRLRLGGGKPPLQGFILFGEVPGALTLATIACPVGALEFAKPIGVPMTSRCPHARAPKAHSICPRIKQAQRRQAGAQQYVADKP